MKRVLCFLSVFLVIFLSGCGGNKVIVKPENLKFDFEISNGGSSFLINAAVHSGGGMEFTVLNPKNIEGFTLVFSDTAVHTEFLGVQKDFPAADGDFGVLGKIYKAFSALSGALAEKQGDIFTVPISIEDDEFIFTVTQMGVPISLDINGQEILFSNIITN